MKGMILLLLFAFVSSSCILKSPDFNWDLKPYDGIKEAGEKWHIYQGPFAIEIIFKGTLAGIYSEHLYRLNNDDSWERWVTLNWWINSYYGTRCDFPYLQWEDDQYVYLVTCNDIARSGNSPAMIVSLHKIDSSEKKITSEKSFSGLKARFVESLEFRGDGSYDMLDYNGNYFVIFPDNFVSDDKSFSQLAVVSFDQKMDREVGYCILSETFYGEVDEKILDISKGLLYIRWHNGSDVYKVDREEFEMVVDLNELIATGTCTH